jgi:hypothetical protein
MEAGVTERDREGLEEVAVGGECQVERLAVNGAQAGELADKIDEAAAQQRLAASEANFGDAERDEETDEAEVLVDAEFGILCADFPGSAVNTLVVAAVGDGDAQVVDDPAMAISEAGLRGY